jgi:DHA1 family bicyclomycin/chloramphenicol resistance-like MFS transporter
MARVMSLSFLVFLGVPILAPALGQLILTVAPWRWVFGVLAVGGTAFAIWAAIRLPETLHPEDRMPIQAGRIASAFREALTNRRSIGYTLAITAISGPCSASSIPASRSSSTSSTRRACSPSCSARLRAA